MFKHLEPKDLRTFYIMKKFVMKCVKLSILLLLVTLCDAKSDFQRQEGGNMGLFPFPRVGRSDPSTNGKFLNVRRREAVNMGLIPFPRTGRSDPAVSDTFAGPHPLVFPSWMLPENMVEYQKRNSGTNVNGGMWFGPRLGRLQKRSFDLSDLPWTFVILTDPSHENKESELIPRLTRESEEDNEDTIVDEIISARRLDSKNRNNVSQQ